MPMFMVLSSWHNHCESSPGSFDEYRTAPSGCRPSASPMTWVRVRLKAARVYTHHHQLLLLLGPKADTHLTVPQRVEG